MSKVKKKNNQNIKVKMRIGKRSIFFRMSIFITLMLQYPNKLKGVNSANNTIECA